jgi:hypothetical protein
VRGARFKSNDKIQTKQDFNRQGLNMKLVDKEETGIPGHPVKQARAARASGRAAWYRG